jgi:hypothetical protein
VAEFCDRLASFCRLIIFDRRGSGASDPLPLNAVSTWEELAEDMTAVLDAAGSNLADVAGMNETGPMAIGLNDPAVTVHATAGSTTTVHLPSTACD